MPVVSPGRYPSSSGSSITSTSFRSTLGGSSSLDKPYYSSATGTYIAPRSTYRSSYERSSSSVSEYRTHSRLSYDSDGVRERKSSYTSDYRYVRAPSISDSDSGISSASRYGTKTERSGSRSRDTSVARSDSARTTRSDSSSKSNHAVSEDFLRQYSPAYYIPTVQKLSSSVTGPNGDAARSGKSYSGDAARLPVPRRTTRNAEDNERNRTARTTAAQVTKSRPSWKNETCRDPAQLSDDNGNDLPLSVAEIRRRFDHTMPVTRLPTHEPLSSSRYKTTYSSDNIYKQVNNLNNSVSSLNDEKPVPVHRPTTSDKYTNGTTGSLKWDYSSSSSSSGYESKDSICSIKRATEPGSDISTIYIACKSNGTVSESNPVNSVKNQLNANNAKILEKSTTVYVGNGEAKMNGTASHNSNVLNIEIGSSNKVSEKQSPPKKMAVTISNHTSDFASYIQISAPAKATSVESESNDVELNNGPSSPKNANRDEVDSGKLRFIDSEPNSESDSKQPIECNGKTNHYDKNDDDDDHDQENGFENKTFEHENGRLLKRISNGIGNHCSDDSDSSDCEQKDEYEPIVKDGDTLNRNDTVTIKASSPISSSPVTSGSSPCGSLTTGHRRSLDFKNLSSGTTENFSKSSGLNGLRNIGNTCFMNSVIQCLSNTRPLLEYCGNPESLTPDINTTLSCMKGALIKAFSQVICELWKASDQDSVVNTTSLKAQIQRFAPRFMGYSQQDAQEFLRYLLEGLHEDVNRVTVKPKPILSEIDDNLSDAQKAQESWQRYLRMEDSRVSDIFVGQLKSSLRCTHCSHTSVTFDPFWDLSLSIPNRTGQLKLTQCLSHFTREEEMDGDEKPTCSKCQTRRKCLKWFTVQKFPQVLVVHLKRFSPTERFRGKLSVPVEFPLTGLNMSAYAATPCAKPPIYNLYAISNHSGTTYSGHYTAYCKHPYNGEWHEYNDSRVSPISPKSIVSSEAYVLFYELVGSSSGSS